MLRIGSVVIRVSNLARQKAFWTAALDDVARVGADVDFVLLRPRTDGGPNVSLDCHVARLENPLRIHLDLYASEQAREVERLRALGASDVHWDKRLKDADYEIVADLEGNRFCVIDADERSAP